MSKTHNNTKSSAEKSIEELFREHHSSSQGLDEEEAQSRLQRYGLNAIEEEQTNIILKFLSYFWGPIPWMIEVAAVLSALLAHWPDFSIIIVMLVLNAVIGFWQEHQAANALEALKSQLALVAHVIRNGKRREIPARELVPGDIIHLRIGDVVPADGKLFEGSYLSVDESSLTGESLPVEKSPGDLVYSGSSIKQGEMDALVIATGKKTFFAKTAELVQSAGAVSHFQRAVLTIGDYLIYISIGLATLLILVQIHRGESFLTIVQFVLILVVASIPVAMPAVLSMTMALGALALSRMKAIVSRLQSIEEIAGIDVLLSDKTGTLTQNKLTLGEPNIFGGIDSQELILAGSLASPREDRDTIDEAVVRGLQDPFALDSYQQLAFTPFDPVHKRTEATLRNPHGDTFSVTKGAPQVILKLCDMDGAARHRVEESVNDLASKGYRTLGIARREGEEGNWSLLGILPLYDPPREDSAETIRHAQEHGIDVKMVTGDNVAIAREISRQLELKTNIQSADTIFDDDQDVDHLPPRLVTRIEQADGFAEVYPEHKYGIVKALQGRGHLVAMTGDGVNDAPALKQAEVGIAVSGAVRAAQAAASLVLTAPGLSVIINAVEEARRIFERMNSYAIYRITETIRIMLFVVAAMVVFNFYPITTVMVILLALLNDLPIITIAYDNTWLSPKPVRWEMRRVLTIATVLGLIGVVETFGLLLIGRLWLKLDEGLMQSFIYLKLAVAGHLTLLVVRNKRPFFSKPYPAPILLVAILATQVVAVLIVGFGIPAFGIARIPWSYVGLVWGYCLVWLFVEDWAKMVVYRHLNLTGKHHRRFITRLQSPIGPE
ncbi:MAG: plasma-membrane proton-efflux P-type ATPase [Pirellulales bacterium]|nr:plasma-membrane proton-efflux P-type ATPase [Pirellulales bacterium]